MTTFPTPMCWGCIHLQPGLKCDAFPDGIPADITESRFDHRMPYPGDNGVLFAQDPDCPEPDWTVFEADLEVEDIEGVVT